MSRRVFTSPIWPALVCAAGALPASAQPGACCFPIGGCTIIGEAPCTSHGGVFLGGGTNCASCGPTGACCTNQGGTFYCDATSQAFCASRNGVFHGAGSSCSPSPCPPQLTGACCIAGQGSCQIVAASQCSVLGGSYRGDNTSCAACACYANCDASTTEPFLNIADFTCFLGRFAAGDLRANCDGSTIGPVLNVQDFICFLNHFTAGC